MFYLTRVSTCSQNDGEGKRLKTPGSRDENDDSKAEAEQSSRKPGDQKTQPPEPPKDYIHVRARRGQATDSHSLAERVIYLNHLVLVSMKEKTNCVIVFL